MKIKIYSRCPRECLVGGSVVLGGASAPAWGHIGHCGEVQPRGKRAMSSPIHPTSIAQLTIFLTLYFPHTSSLSHKPVFFFTSARAQPVYLTTIFTSLSSSHTPAPFPRSSSTPSPPYLHSHSSPPSSSHYLLQTLHCLSHAHLLPH